MTTATRPRFRPGADVHPSWCSHGHACGLGEHRADPVTLDGSGGVIVLTRVQTRTGRQHVEIRTRIALNPGHDVGRAHLAHILTELDAHLRRVIRPPR